MDGSKLCVFVTGANCAGKSALARAIINRYGGIDREAGQVTYLRKGRICLAGRYKGLKFGGVDKLKNEKGNVCTSVLADVVGEAFNHADIIVCEGSYMDTFGQNLTNAMFKAGRHLVVNLVCSPRALLERLKERSNGKNGKYNILSVLRRQHRTILAAKKWHSIGVRVLQINTAKYGIDEVLEQVLSEMRSLVPNKEL